MTTKTLYTFSIDNEDGKYNGIISITFTPLESGIYIYIKDLDYPSKNDA